MKCNEKRCWMLDAGCREFLSNIQYLTSRISILVSNIPHLFFPWASWKNLVHPVWIFCKSSSESVWKFQDSLRWRRRKMVDSGKTVRRSPPLVRAARNSASWKGRRNLTDLYQTFHIWLPSFCRAAAEENFQTTSSKKIRRKDKIKCQSKKILLNRLGRDGSVVTCPYFSASYHSSQCCVFCFLRT